MNIDERLILPDYSQQGACDWFAASRLRPLLCVRLADVAMLFLRFAASEKVASCVFGVY